jgi:transcriptional antiterminator RfaH
MTGLHWHAVHTKPHQESLAALSLKRLRVETFCPQLKQMKLIRRRRQEVIRPLFPGYLFARFDGEIQYRAVNYAAGVQRVVAWGTEPAIVDDGLIASIRARLRDGCVIVPPALLIPGQHVRILEGPLQGLDAVFERELSDEQRVIVLLQALSYKARVVIDRESVEQAHGPLYLAAA